MRTASKRSLAEPHRVVQSWAQKLVLWGLASWAACAQGQTIFACEPEWAALTKALLPKAQVLVATHANQDPHHIEARPALIAQLRVAQAAICTGAGLESGWLPTLQERSGNARVQARAPSMFYAADVVSLIDAQATGAGNPFAGDIHEQGNPHIHTDPRRMLEVAAAWREVLSREFPTQAASIRARHDEFTAKWRIRTAEWQTRLAPFRAARVAAQHTSYAYLWQWLGIQQVADLEPRPGMAPTPGHLQKLLLGLQANPPAAIVLTSYQDPRAAQWLRERLARQTNKSVPLLVLPATVTDPLAPDALIHWMDTLIDALARTLSAGPAAQHDLGSANAQTR